MSAVRDVYDKRFSVMFHGASRDSGADSAPAFLSAGLAAVNDPRGGNHVFVPSGVFSFTPVQAGAAVLFAAANVVESLTFEGVGMYETVLEFTDPDAESALFGFVDCGKIVFKNIGFNGGVTTGTRVAWNRAIDFRGCEQVNLDHIRSTFTGNSAFRVARKGLPGSDAIPHGTRASSDVLVEGCRIEDAYGSGGILTKSAGANNVIITNNFFTRFGIQAISLESEDPVDGVTDERHGNHIVSNNMFRDSNAQTFGQSNTGYGLAIQEFVHKQVVSGNVFDNIGGFSGIDVTTSSTQSDTLVEQLIISDNMINGVNIGSRKAGINLRSGDADLKNISITDNHVYGADYGVQFYPNTQATTLGVISDVKVSDNRFVVDNIGVYYNNVDGNSAAKNPIENCVVTDNRITAGQLGIQLFAVDSQITDNLISATPGGTGFTHSVGMRTGSTRNVVNNNPGPDAVNISTRLNNDFSVMQLGEWYLWVDSSGRLRIVSALVRPTLLTRDTAGVVVGGQV